MEDKIYWKSIFSLITAVGIILIMFTATMNLVSQIENDKDVWFHKDVKWESCACSTEVSEYFDMCQEFIKRCQIELRLNYTQIKPLEKEE